MINQKEDIINSIGKIIFIIFFFFLISSFSNKSFNQTNSTTQYNVTYELRSNDAKAIIANAIQLPSFQKSCTLILYNTNISLFDEIYKINADDKKITQRIILLQKTQPLIKPLFFYRFYYHLISTDTEDLPILS